MKIALDVASSHVHVKKDYLQKSQLCSFLVWARLLSQIVFLKVLLCKQIIQGSFKPNDTM